MENEICKICGKGPFSRMDIHLRQTHSMTKEEYDNMEENENEDEIVEDKDDLEEIEEDEIVESKVVTPHERTTNIFKGAKHEYPRDLDGFLEHFKITEKDLLSLVKRFNEGSSISVTKTMQNNMNSAEAKAAALVKESGNNIKTRNLYVAEILTKKYGFVCTVVTSKPKEWILEKP
jgi:hypothetical protein